MSKRKRLELELELAQAERERASSQRTGSGESFLRGAGQGLSMGFIDEATAMGESALGSMGFIDDKTYDQSLAESRAAYKQAEEQNPVAYGAGDYGSTIALGLATGGASMAGAGLATGAKLLGRAGLREGLKKLATKEAARGLIGKGAVAAGEGALEGIGRSEADTLGGIAQDAAIGGSIGAVAPTVLKGAGKVLGLAGKGVSAAIPRVGKEGFISTPLTNASMGAAKILGVKPKTVETYRELLADPKRLKTAQEAAEIDDYEPFRKSAVKFEEKIRGAASKKYDDLSGQAFQKLGQDGQLKEIQGQGAEAMGELADLVGAIKPKRASKGQLAMLDPKEKAVVLSKERAQAQAFKDKKSLYQQRTRDDLTNAMTIIQGRHPKTLKLQKEAFEAAQRGDPNAAALMDDYNFQLGKTVSEAKQRLGDGISWAGTEKWTEDEKVLRDAFGQLRAITHSEGTPGGAQMKQADEFWESFKNEGEPMLKNFKGKDPDGLSSGKIDDWVNDSGGKSRHQRDILKKSMTNFLEKNFDEGDAINVNTLNTFEKQFQPHRDVRDIGRLGKEGLTGGGKGIITQAALATGVYVNPVVGSLVAAVLAPVTNPAMYLKSVNALRNMMADMSEKEAKTAFGKSYQAVVKAVGKGATKAGRLEGPKKGQDLYESFDFGEGSTITPRQ